MIFSILIPHISLCCIYDTAQHLQSRVILTLILCRYPPNLARPLDICIEASNGASDYGNKYGEPVVAGFARSFGQRMPDTGKLTHEYTWLRSHTVPWRCTLHAAEVT